MSDPGWTLGKMIIANSLGRATEDAEMVSVDGRWFVVGNGVTIDATAVAELVSKPDWATVERKLPPDLDFEKLADEAERGYDVATIIERRRHRP